MSKPVRTSDLREVVIGGRELRQRLKNVPSTKCPLSRGNGSVQTSSADLKRCERRRDVVRVVVPARVEGLIRKDDHVVTEVLGVTDSVEVVECDNPPSNTVDREVVAQEHVVEGSVSDRREIRVHVITKGSPSEQRVVKTRISSASDLEESASVVESRVDVNQLALVGPDSRLDVGNL